MMITLIAKVKEKTMANTIGQTGLVTSFDGKSIQVNYDANGLYLYIDGNLHTQQKGAGAVFNSKKPAMQMDFPFTSGTKKLEVYYKMGLLKQKFKLFIDGQFVAGDKF
jgi:hypothetical protein